MCALVFVSNDRKISFGSAVSSPCRVAPSGFITEDFCFSTPVVCSGPKGKGWAVSDPWLRWDASVVYESTPDVLFLLRGGVRLSVVWCMCHRSHWGADVCRPAVAAASISLSVCF